MKKTYIIYILLTVLIFFCGTDGVAAATQSGCTESGGKIVCNFYKSDGWTFKKITGYKELCMSTTNSYTGSGQCVFHYKETVFDTCLVYDSKKKKYVAKEDCDPEVTKDKEAIYDPSNKKTISDGYVTKESDISSSSNSNKKSWSRMELTFSDRGQLGLAYDMIKSDCNNNPKQPIKYICNQGSKVTNDEKNDHVQDAVTPESEKDDKLEYEDEYDYNLIGDSWDYESCEEKLGPDLVERIQSIVDLIKIAVPIILIIYGIIDFGKAIFIGDENEMKKSQSKFIKRLIVAVGFFLVPTLVQLVLNIAHQVWPEIDPSLCGIKF